MKTIIIDINTKQTLRILHYSLIVPMGTRITLNGVLYDVGHAPLIDIDTNTITINARQHSTGHRI